mgnify:CR=1 FL=1
MCHHPSAARAEGLRVLMLLGAEQVKGTKEKEAEEKEARK